MDIKEIALNVADSLRNKIDGISHMQSNQGLVAFAEALIAELAKQNEPKNVKYCCYEKVNGELQWFREGTLKGFKRIPELDREITLPEGGVI